MLKVCFTGAYACLGKTWAKISPPRQYWIILIFMKRVAKQAIRGGMENFEIVAILNQYKDILDDFIDSSNLESLDRVELIDEKSRNISISKAV